MLSTRSWHFGIALRGSEIQEMFPNLNNIFISADVNAKELLDIMSEHLKELATKISYYFPEAASFRNENFWINNPSIENANACAPASVKKKACSKCVVILPCYSDIEKNHCLNYGYLMKTNISLSVTKQSKC